MQNERLQIFSKDLNSLQIVLLVSKVGVISLQQFRLFLKPRCSNVRLSRSLLEYLSMLHIRHRLKMCRAVHGSNKIPQYYAFPKLKTLAGSYFLPYFLQGVRNPSSHLDMNQHLLVSLSNNKKRLLQKVNYT